PPTSTLFPYTTLFRSDHEPARFELLGRRALERHSLIADVPPNGVGPSSLAAGGRCQLALEMGDVVPVAGQSRGPCDCGERFADRSEEHTSELQSPYDL